MLRDERIVLLALDARGKVLEQRQAALSQAGPLCVGSGALASGTVTATAVGNTIAVRLTFPSLNGTAYYAWSHKPLVPPTS